MMNTKNSAVFESKQNHSKVNTGHVIIENLNIIFNTSRGEEVHAVKDFSMETMPGEFVCLIGPSGCGKSTVLNTVAGFVKPKSGQLLLDEKPILNPDPERGIVFQDYALFPWKSIQKNVEFGLKLQGVDKETRKQISLEKISQVRLSGFESKYPHELSGGMQQRVGIARILASNPRVMLMDEPFGALDAQTREMMQELLLEVWDQYRTTVIFITHDLDEAIFLSDKIIMMSARPGTVKDVFINPLPRPRKFSVTTSEEFIELKRVLTTSLREEIEATLTMSI